MLRILQWPLISFSLLILLTSCISKTSQINPAMPQIQYSLGELQKEGRSSASDSVKKENLSYLALNLPFTEFEKIRKNIEAKQGLTLQHRGEAHITVITPPEYKKLSKKVSMQEITALADEMDLLHSPYKLLCVGKASITEQEKAKATYYVVVQSDRLFQIRKAVEMLFVKKGGAAGDFSSDVYYPHVTLGFTDRDLHYEDGVIKDASSCLYSLSPASTSDAIKN